MIKKSKKVLSFTLSILIFTSIFFSFPITTNAAVVEESEVGAGNQNVIDAQTWLNNTYSGRAGYTPIDIDGVSYSTTFITLVKAFQIELGFPESKITGTFGSQTKAASPTFEINKTNNNNMVRILQYGLRCKGYYDTNITDIIFIIFILPRWYDGENKKIWITYWDIECSDSDTYIVAKLFKWALMVWFYIWN